MSCGNSYNSKEKVIPSEKTGPSVATNYDVLSTDLNFENVKFPKIAVHDGPFQCDDVLAVSMLTMIPQLSDSEIVRTRDYQVLNECDYVMDVGGVYDHENRRYDHHQRGFQVSMKSLDPTKSSEVKLSSAGLIYFHYGINILASILSTHPNDPKCIGLYDKIYDCFVKEVDAIDNGEDAYTDKDVSIRYSINTGISSRIARMNPILMNNESNYDEKFFEAVKYMKAEFSSLVKNYSDTWWKSRNFVIEAIENRFNTHPCGRIIKLDNKVVFREHILDLEKEHLLENEILYVIKKQNGDEWRITCVPSRMGSFESRMPLRQDWRGLRTEHLVKLCGIDDIIFVHHSGFTGGARSFEGVLKMAFLTMEDNDVNISQTKV